jgi:hypothetical protein
MSRKDWIWIVIKAFGVYLGIETILIVPSLMMIFNSRLSSGDAFMAVLPRFILQGVLSLYLLKSGRLVFWLIGPIAQSPDSTT